MADLVYMTKTAWTALLNAIRTKGGTSAPMTAAQAKTAVDVLKVGYNLEEIGEHDYGSGSVTYLGTRLYPYTFVRTSITEIHAPNLTHFTDAADGASSGVGTSVFRYCAALTVIDLPNLEYVGSGGYQFSDCTALKTVFLPIAYGGQYMFSGCSSLETAVIGVEDDSPSSMNGHAFENCTELHSVDLNTTRVYSSEFNNASKLKTLVLRRADAISTLYNINAFNNTPFASGKTGGTLYVPSALIASYQAATNWSTILGYANNQILPIEGSVYETEYVDGTLIE